MIKKKILIIAPYPIKNPAHGGQKRTKAIVEFYKSIFSEVKFIAVFNKQSYSNFSSEDIALGKWGVEHRDQEPLLEDLIVGQAIDKDIHVRSHMAEILLNYKPDIIQVEQVYPFLGLKVLLDELNLKPKLILSSQNVEHVMKRKILEDLDLLSGKLSLVVEQIKTLEYQASKKVDLVIAASQQDAYAHKKMGARKIVVAVNGIEKILPSEKALNKWKNFKRNNSIKTSITFVGSPHPPNWLGFSKLLGNNMDFLPEGVRLLMAGGVSDHFQKSDKPFLSKVKLLGRLSDDELAGLIDQTDIFLLPIISGGGSNLKTAEAILSGKKIVATNYAFRGFERYLKLPNIYLGNSSVQFKKAILKALSTELVKRTPKQVDLAETVQWKYCLAPIEYDLRKAVKRSVKEYSTGKVRLHLRPIRKTFRKIKRR